MESFAAARIISSSSGETFTSAVNSGNATGFEVISREFDPQTNNTTFRSYSFNLEGVQQSAATTLQGADLIRAEIQLGQDLDGDGIKGIRIEGTNPLSTTAHWSMPNGHSVGVYSTNTEYLLVSTRSGLTTGSDLSAGSLTDTHALLTTDGEVNYTTGPNKTLVAAFTTDSDGTPINTRSNYNIGGFELLLRSDTDNSVSQVSFNSDGILQGQKDLTAEEIINFELLMINDIDGDGVRGFRFVSELLSPDALSTTNTYRMRLSETIWPSPFGIEYESHPRRRPNG